VYTTHLSLAFTPQHTFVSCVFPTTHFCLLCVHHNNLLSLAYTS